MGSLDIDKSIKKSFMIPAPILVGIELNPGPLTPDVRKEIAILKRAGLSNKKIAKTLQKNIKTVKRWVNRASAKPSRHDQSKVFNSKSSSAIARSYQTQWRTNKLLTSYSTTLQTKTEITGVLHILREKAK
jgi:transposase